VPRRRIRRRPGYDLVGITKRPAERAPSPKRLDDRQREWLEDGILDEDWVRATRKFYPEHPNPFRLAHQLVNTPKLASAIEIERRRTLRRIHVEKGWIIERCMAMVRADPNEIVEHRRVPCRYCHGENHRYQFRDTEMELLLGIYQCGVNKEKYHLLDQYTDLGGFGQAYYDLGLEGRSFDPQGGDGYTTRRQIFSVVSGNECDCPVCDGHGMPLIFVHDTRYLSASAQLLYEGVEQTSGGGYRIKLRDRAPFEKALMNHFGFGTERKEVLVRRLDIDNLTDEEMRQAILEAEVKATLELEGDEFEEVDAAIE
jgi:phage terminase small subunit